MDKRTLLELAVDELDNAPWSLFARRSIQMVLAALPADFGDGRLVGESRLHRQPRGVLLEALDFLKQECPQHEPAARATFYRVATLIDLALDAYVPEHVPTILKRLDIREKKEPAGPAGPHGAGALPVRARPVDEKN